ncbi:hypothetical protein [Curtobacterium flaccumfaciens]|uniref:hypothetical protein n=1 Tax=Curtobacterium flaccumfaciens TaxID=2035 RepID=UPI001E55800D|nr:hypothetical protein [Curtobacterium allii]MCE0458436.1 hypothetical protein [Curtobacterium allii]
MTTINVNAVVDEIIAHNKHEEELARAVREAAKARGVTLSVSDERAAVRRLVNGGA